MAFSSALRRALSSAAPLAARAAARRAVHHAAAPLLRGHGVAPEIRRASLVALSSQRLRFSTVSSDANLLRVIDAEVQCALESEDSEASEIPTKFPFKISDEPGKGIVTLTRDFHGENIQVIVSMPSIVGDEEGEDGKNEDDEDNQSSQSSIPLVVTVLKGNGPHLEFCCTAYPDEVAIQSLSVKEADRPDEDLAYEGPEFSDLDENLQKAFHKYLEIRGITAAATNFLHEYMINKDNREYVSWMKNLKEFIAR